MTGEVVFIADEGWAASSVNVLANQCNTLVTSGEHQWAVFYDATGHLVIARRLLGQSHWDLSRTPHTGRVNDAHDTAVIAVDGDGYLHVAWDHHCSPLNYARGVAPGALELSAPEPMTRSNEQRVTYPAFLRLPDGGLLFFYRHGAPRNAVLVLNRYDLATRRWRQVHRAVVSGEGTGSAYAAMHLDESGTLHLAWNWRDNADVASNHDLCYASSSDFGETWSTTRGQPLQMPITSQTAEYALRLPQNHSLMNPPALTADADGRPCLVSYWAPPGTDVPQFHLVRHDGIGWSVSQITRRRAAFSLHGKATKHPPISRAAIVARRSSHGGNELHMIYRDDELGEHVFAVSCNDVERPRWIWTQLTDASVGAWEPSVDAQQWRLHGKVHMLLQNVRQRDGNDNEGGKVAATPVSVLSWGTLVFITR
ncbi:BNR repeat-containing protein [Caenimonas sp. SL110]|uniref:BNR repeat-containing protein n=1 Tax=Caenimonas sp. SL110 TaxID=1450524 RepID=UPI0006528C09|nr:BNR repeat-containing protein [Caenimonas sp. SL110]